MQKITPFLWFDGKAQEAANFYVSAFKNSQNRQPHARGRTESPVRSHSRSMDAEFIAFNGGPHFTFSPAISLFVRCETQSEIDELWEKLSEGGEKQRCGWLKDKYGVSWQIVPPILGELLQGKDAEKAKRVMSAMLKMQKLDIEGLKNA